MQKNDFFSKNKSIVTFLILEIMALCAFNFGNISVVFAIAGALVAVVGILFVVMMSENKKQLLFLIPPVAILFIISGIGSFNAFSQVEGFKGVSNVALFLALPAFFILGFVVRKLGDVKPRTVLLTIGAGLAAITLFGLFSTIIQRGIFYAIRFKKTPNYYYNGMPYDVTAEMDWLFGFEFKEVYMEYGSLFAILSAAYLPSLLFVSPKENKNEFLAIAGIGGVGLITLLLVPNFKAIIVLIVASAFAFIYKYLRNHKKAQKIIGISFISVVGLGILFYLVCLINAAAGFVFSGALGKLFAHNRFLNGSEEVFAALFARRGGKLVNINGFSGSISYEEAIWKNTQIFEVQILKEIGLFGSLLFIAFVCCMGYFAYRYLKHGDDGDETKTIIVVLLLTFFIYESLFNSVSAEVHEDVYNAFFRTTPIYVVLFIFGFLYFAEKKEEEIK